jgi:hypothetical protein
MLLDDTPNILKLGEKEYTLPKLTYPLIRNIEQKFGTGLVALAMEIAERKSLTTMMDLICFLIPELKQDDFSGRVGMGDISNIIQAITVFLNGD